MDIFKIRLNKALSSNRIGKLEGFLLKEGKRNKDKIRKYADYILKNCSDYNWITSYLIMYDGDELIDAIINNYNKLKENNIDTYPIINRITKYPNDKLISYIDKLIPVIDDFTLRNILDKIKDNEDLVYQAVLDDWKYRETFNFLTNKESSKKKFSEVQEEPFYISCPAKEANIKNGYTVKEDGFVLKDKEVKDPIVLKPVVGGFLIVTKWGLESEDSDLINPNFN